MTAESELGLEPAPDENRQESLADVDKFSEALHGVPDPLVTVQVFRRPETGKWEYCFSFALGDYTEADLLDKITTEYGPGVYPVQGGRPRSKRDKRRSIVFQKNLKIATNRRVPHPAPTAATPDITGIAAAIEGQTKLLAQLVEKVNAPPPSILDSLEKIASIKDLFAPAVQDPIASVTQVIELMKTIREQDPAGETDPWAGAIKHLMPAINAGVESLQRDQAQRERAEASRRRPAGGDTRSSPGRPTVLRNPTAANPDTPTAATADPNAVKIPPFVRMFLPLALTNAADETDPVSMANLVLGFVNESNVEDVLDVICHDDMIGYLNGFDQRVRQYERWFERVADHLAEKLIPDDAETEAGEGSEAAENDSDSATIVQIDKKQGIIAGESRQAPSAVEDPPTDAHTATPDVKSPDDAHPDGDSPGD